MAGKKIIAKIPAALPLFAAAALALMFCQAPFDLAFLAWIAWTPFILACRPGAGGWKFFLCAYLVGVTYWLGNLYWVALVTAPGYVCFGLFQGLYWPVLAFAARYARRKNLPLVPAAAVLFVGAEAVQSVLFTGFSWYFLSHSQYRNLHLIQIADIFGASGVSVLVAMANGLAAEIIIRQTGKSISSKRIAIQAAALACLLWAAVGYGHYRLSQSRQNVQPGPVVASVQPNIPSSVKEQNENAGQILEEMLALTKESLQSKPVLVVWPETIVLSVLNPAYVQLCPQESEPKEFDRRISQAAKDNAYLLVGAHAASVSEKDFQYIVSDKFNSAFLYRPDGVQDTKRYDKIHLVPFGEYIPFKKSAPWIYNLFMKLSPYDYDYNLTPGENYTLFEIKDQNREYHFGVSICYEDTDADLAGKMTLAGGKGEKTDWIVNISNDGWYVRFRNNKVIPTVELAQRTAISVFRCVENRISILKSVNTGISCLIDPVGKIQNDYLMGTLPRNAMERQGVAGWFADAIPIDGRISFFTKHGRWLDAILGFGLFILLAAGIIERKKHRREKE